MPIQRVCRFSADHCDHTRGTLARYIDSPDQHHGNSARKLMSAPDLNSRVTL